MSNQVNPLTIFDTRNRPRIEPFVSSVMRTQTRARGRLVLVNDFIAIQSYADGKPGVLNRWSNLEDLEAYHDPTQTGDQGVALCRTARLGFAGDVNGSADQVTYRVDQATPSFAYIKAGATNLIKVTRQSYGYQANGSVGGATHKVLAGSAQGKKAIFSTGAKAFTLDNIGRLMGLKYTGNGTVPVVTIRPSDGLITYTGQPADQDKITLNGKVFEFESVGGVTVGNVPVTIGADQDATFANLVTAITAELGAAGVTALQNATANTVAVSAPDQGIALTETTDSGNVFSVATSGQGVFLETKIGAGGVNDATDGSQPLAFSLTSGPYRTLQLLVNYINKQQGYDAAISPYADGALLSVGLDPVTAVSISATANLTGYVAALTNAINTRTQGNFVAEALVYGTEPDEVLASAAATPYTGGSSPVATITDYDNALTAVAAQVELGGVIFVDSTDPVVLTHVAEFCALQQANGKWFRMYGALDPANPANAAVAPATVADRISAMLDVAGQVDLNLAHLSAQRMQKIGAGGEILTLPSLYLAAALGGAAAGNLPFSPTLSNKQLRFPAIYPADEFTVDQRESLIAGGIIVAKKERDIIKVVINVTTSHDPTRSMERVASERATADLVDANVKEAFLSFRGDWVNADIEARVNGTLRNVLERFTAAGALVKNVEDDGTVTPPWQTVSVAPNGQCWVYQAGQLSISYQIFLGGELRGINLRGNAEYARIAGTLITSALTLTTVVPLT